MRNASRERESKPGKSIIFCVKLEALKYFYYNSVFFHFWFYFYGGCSNFLKSIFDFAVTVQLGVLGEIIGIY